MKARIAAFAFAFILVLGICAPLSAAHAQERGGVRPAVSAQIHVAARATLFDKTRFLLHAGAAFYAFHHFVYKRYKDGGFDANASGRKTNFVKAGVALLFAYHELKVSYGIANGSSSKTLHALVAPINGLLGLLDKERTKITNGNYDPKDLTNLNTSVTSLGDTASKAGYGISDVTIPVPGAS